ncbi:General vesicular transport factor p115 [Acipenser ruthenus]|uniref:General vesicular transport factor p115 n=1 Tax=Acipenser ruthenus TaxID=7906 RepID=A0A662YZ86_ACIRT|nr:General vesicular transport factor p115 [Acipenser ruthenus]
MQFFAEEGKIWSDSKAALEQQVATANSSVAILQNEKSKLQQEVAESKKEQDDLLMLLADQDQKIKSLKDKLKELGEPIEEDDDLDCRDQYDEDEDDDDDDD